MRFIATLVFSVVLAACGAEAGEGEAGGGPEGAADAEASETGPAAARVGAAEGPGTEDRSPLCSAVASVDLGAAFGGGLTFGTPRSLRGRPVCMVPVRGAEGEGLIVQKTSAGFYEAKAGYEDQGVPFERLPDLGREAFIINNADLNVLLDEDEALSVGLSAIFTGGQEPPPGERLREGLVRVARAVIEETGP